MKTSRVLLNISAFICFVFGAIYLFTLVFIPIAVYCFIAGKRFSSKAEHIDDLYSIDNRVFKNYVVFASIACFPLGLISIIPYLRLTGNNIKINRVEEESKVTITTNETVDEKKEEVQSVEAQKEDILSDEEKMKKFKKLENFKEKGLITEDELEMAREQLFGKSKNSEE